MRCLKYINITPLTVILNGVVHQVIHQLIYFGLIALYRLNLTCYDNHNIFFPARNSKTVLALIRSAAATIGAVYVAGKIAHSVGKKKK